MLRPPSRPALPSRVPCDRQKAEDEEEAHSNPSAAAAAYFATLRGGPSMPSPAPSSRRERRSGADNTGGVVRTSFTYNGETIVSSSPTPSPSRPRMLFRQSSVAPYGGFGSKQILHG